MIQIPNPDLVDFNLFKKNLKIVKKFHGLKLFLLGMAKISMTEPILNF